MKNYAARAAIADTVLTEHEHPAVVAVVLYGHTDEVQIQTTVPIPGVDYAADKGRKGTHYYTTTEVDGVTVRLVCYVEKVTA